MPIDPRLLAAAAEIAHGYDIDAQVVTRTLIRSSQYVALVGPLPTDPRDRAAWLYALVRALIVGGVPLEDAQMITLAQLDRDMAAVGVSARECIVQQLAAELEDIGARIATEIEAARARAAHAKSETRAADRQAQLNIVRGGQA